MIPAVIRWSLRNRVFVILLALLLGLVGIYTIENTAVDAIPDLSDVQVIIKTSYPGRAPQVVEDQITYPLTTAMLAVPGSVTVRAESGFGESYVYILLHPFLALHRPFLDLHFGLLVLSVPKLNRKRVVDLDST